MKNWNMEDKTKNINIVVCLESYTPFDIDEPIDLVEQEAERQSELLRSCDHYEGFKKAYYRQTQHLWGLNKDNKSCKW